MRHLPDTRSPRDLLHPTERSRHGVALVLVLAFIVLLSGLVLAFFSRAISDRQISNGSANQTRVELFAQGDLDTVVGDLKQEIVAGAASPAPSPLPAGVNLYPPKQTTAAPYRVGTASTLPNLVKTSASTQAFYSNTAGTTNYNIASYPASNRASAVSSTTPSQNGRAITTKRWNSHYLLPKQTPATDTDATPISSFTAPDWVMVARNGSNPGSNGSTIALGTGGGNDPSVTNQNYVIGRYAYAIYDEGGLLDMNVAGCPSNTSILQMGYKPAVAMADLTQIGLTQNQIDQIVGWRNYASTAQTGIFPNPSPTPAFSQNQATNYYNFVLGNWSSFGFLSTANVFLSSGTTGQSDRMFPDRQSLMRLLTQGIAGSVTDPTTATTRANLQNAMQYMGTFSRDLEQPSFFPDVNRPLIQSGPGVTAVGNSVVITPSDNVASFGTGNDAYGVDRNADPSTDINPPFLAVRVTSVFTRADGTQSVVGEPLVKKRFPLSRLGNILYTSTASNSDPTDKIYRDFGLYRSSNTGPWLYSHTPNVNATGIQRLSAVTGREPDFFELLKAAINVGAEAKKSLLYDTSPNSTINWQTIGSAMYLQQASHDVYTDLQILQIGANIIDQYDTDSYPTRIQFAGDSSKEVRGIEDLPYLYRFRLRAVKQQGSSDATRLGGLFVTPELWNPHYYNGGAAQPNSPTQFQITAAPAFNGGTTQYEVTYGSDGTNQEVKTINWSACGTISFSLPSSPSPNNLFREPTLLQQQGIPTGTTSSLTMQDNDTGKYIIGLQATTFDWQHTGGTGSSGATTGTASDTYIGLDPNHAPVTISLQYVANGVPITYDQQTYEWGAISGGNPKFTIKALQSQLQLKGNTQFGGNRVDPRTCRWGVALTDFQYLLPYIDLANFVWSSGWPSPTNTGGPDGNMISGVNGTNPAYGMHFGVPQDNGFTSAFSPYSNAEDANHQARYEGFDGGYWSENTIRPQTGAFGDASVAFYNRDPDGVARRAMGGYASDANSGGSATNANGLPMVTAAYTGTSATPNATQMQSRPLILNRPFNSVAELGYVFTDTPWKNLDMSFPESPDAALLDVFCLNELSNPDALTAGKVDLNTRQLPVLQALFNNTLIREELPTAAPGTSSATLAALAQALVTRTSGTGTQQGPLGCRSDLVGRWCPRMQITGTSAAKTALQRTGTPNGADPDQYYAGFSSDIGTVTGLNGTPAGLVTREREAAIRALVDAGTARTWNLMIDLVAQTGRYPANTTDSSQFIVDGEKRYWLHVAIDRATGTVIDQHLEAVTD